MGNSFVADCDELVDITSGYCAAEDCIQHLRQIEQCGISQYRKFVKHVIEDGDRSVHDAIKKNSFAVFRKKKKTCKEGHKIQTLRIDLKIFTQLYVANQHRSGDMKTFF